MVTKFGTGIDLDNISEKFEGQGHRSKVKVIHLKKVIFRVLAWVLYVINDIMISCAVCTEFCACTHKCRAHECAKSQNMHASTNRFGTREVQQHFSVFYHRVI